MTDKPWKILERDIAHALGEERVLQKGTKVPDIVHWPYVIDTKKRKNLNVWAAFQEVKRKYGKDHIPVMIWAKPGTGYRKALVILEFQDWIAGK